MEPRLLDEMDMLWQERHRLHASRAIAVSVKPAKAENPEGILALDCSFTSCQAGLLAKHARFTTKAAAAAAVGS